jgi:RNA polymerase sigma-70 factor (ECF subfamily)
MVAVIATSPLTMCGCPERVTRLARDHARRLAAIARREGATATDALDLVQDAFHTLMARTDVCAIDDDDGAARVLAAIVRNAARNHRRRHHHAKPHADLDELAATAPGIGCATGASGATGATGGTNPISAAAAADADAIVPAQPPRADELIERAETAVQLGACMATLDDRHRHVVTLRVLEELSGDEAAAALGLTPGHVAVMLHRARKALERCMTAAIAAV